MDTKVSTDYLNRLRFMIGMLVFFLSFSFILNIVLWISWTKLVMLIIS